MAVDVKSEDGQIIRKLIPLATLPVAQFNALCAEITIEETQDGFLFKRGDDASELVYLISGEVTLQAAGLVVEVIAADSESARFALAHQIPRKIDAVANGRVRFLRLDTEMVKNPSAIAKRKEEKSYMVIDETEGESDDWMTALLRSPIFQRLPPANLQKILMSLEAVHYKKGEVILEQGGTGDYYYLIKSGRCLLTRKPTPTAKEIKLAQLGNGDTFGEDALLSGATRNVTITALTDISLLRLDKERFISLIKEPSLKFISFDEMQEVVRNGALLLDVRSMDDYEKNHLDGSINAPFFSLRMQLKTFSHDRPIVVVCQEGRTSEAAAFLLLRHKLDAMILKGGMNGVAPKQAVADEPAEVIAPVPEQVAEVVSPQAPDGEAVEKPAVEAGAVTGLENQIRVLKAENDTLKQTNQQLNDKCMKLEFDKQNIEKQYRILRKQMEKLTQVLDRLKGGGQG